MASNLNRFTEEEDQLLHFYHNMGLTVAQTAEAMERPFGSVATRRRRLGLAERRGPNCRTLNPTEYTEAEYKEAEYVETPQVTETPAVDAEAFDLITMRKYVVYFYGACLFAAGLLAFLGDV